MNIIESSAQQVTASNSSKVGLGTWQLGGASMFGGRPNGWGSVTEQDALEVLREAVEGGITFFDTADMYGWGMAEQRLGKVLREFPEVDFTVCTKFGNREDRHGGAFKDFSVDWLRTSVESSLKRLRRDYIDLLLLHSPPDDFAWSDYDPAPFERLIQEGKIASYGVSCQSPEGALRCLHSGFGTAIEGIYNVIDRRMERDVFALCREKRVSFIARVPLASGFLSRRTLHEVPNFLNDDVRNLLPGEEVRLRTEAVRRVAFLDRLPGGITVSAIRFSISNSAVSFVVPGARSVAQVKGICSAWQLGALDVEYLREVDQVLPHYGYKALQS